MGVNSHVLPGDIVVTCDRAWTIDVSLIDRWCIEADTVCTVLEVAPAGSSGTGHMFRVMAPNGKIGWLYNHHVRPLVTQRHVADPNHC